jgi:hypothetical protein
MKALTDVFYLIQTGTTMEKRYPLQNAILKKDTLVKEMMVGMYAL